jgi:hypothetical protein
LADSFTNGSAAARIIHSSPLNPARKDHRKYTMPQYALKNHDHQRKIITQPLTNHYLFALPKPSVFFHNNPGVIADFSFGGYTRHKSIAATPLARLFEIHRCNARSPGETTSTSLSRQPTVSSDARRRGYTMLGLQKITVRTKTLAGFFLTVFLLLIAIIFTPDAQVHQTYAASPSRTKQAQGQTASSKKPQHSVSNIPATGEQTGTLSGIASWAGQQSTNAVDVLAVNTTTGSQQDVNPDRFGSGSYSMDLPVGIYDVTAKVLGYARGVPDTVITQQTVSIGAQTTTTLNFDYSTVTGLVSGDLIVNHMQSGGSVGNNWPFHPPGFALAIPSGAASIQIFDTNDNLAGQATVTVINGAQVLLDSASDSVPSGGNVSAPLGNLTLTFSRVTHTGKASAIATNSLQGGAAPLQV